MSRLTQQNKVLAIIPARAGSKRLPNKNIKLLAGKPLICWTVEAAKNTKLDMDVVVSTDSQMVADIALGCGADVPFLRPAELASDTASTFDVLEDTINKLAAQGRHYEYLILLQPTSPLRQSIHIEQAFERLLNDTVKSVVSVTAVEHPIEWTMTLPVNNCLDSFIANQLSQLKIRSQDLPKRYQLNGAIMCGRLQDIMAEKSFYLQQGTYAYEMDKQFSVDIDYVEDFEYAEFLVAKHLTNIV